MNEEPIYDQLDDDETEYIRLRMRRFYQNSKSNFFNTGGEELYQNKQGRCEDAPCCGCCNF